MKTLRIMLLLGLLLGGSVSFAQRGHGHQGNGGHRGNGEHRGHGNKKVVIRRSAYRPRTVVVYHPHWRPAYSCHRRWVYFPARNLYWDNWRNHYVFWNGAMWVSQASAPPVIVNVNLSNEKTVELKEDSDDDDDVYKSNDQHKTEYKSQ